MEYYEIAPVTAVRTNQPTLTYHSDSPLQIGQTVRIEIGKKQANGVVIQRVNKPSYTTKAITSELQNPLVPNQLIKLSKWMSSYYASLTPIVWQALLPRGLDKKRRKLYEPVKAKSSNTLPPLRKQQTSALRQLENAPAETALLHGVTGSGKTFVYIARAQALLAQGKSVIVLVPEIGLTTQLIETFETYVTPVFVTHSRMTESERHAAWQSIGRHADPCVIIGPRSALFSPRDDIGLIVIDEFHEPSYKQDQNPKYSAIRVAAKLAHIHAAQLILGSATPPVSERYYAEQKSSSIIEMPSVAMSGASASITVVNVKIDKPVAKNWLSLPSKKAIDQTLKAHRQVLVFHNRRGTAGTNLCNECGWKAVCPNCHLPLTLHADWHQLRCHVCNYRTKPFTSCPDCKNTDIVFRGIGTKQIEDDLRSLYPAARIARFDTDNARSESLEQRYGELRDGSIDIIVGTQTVAKGLDLPLLETVIVPLADVGLYIPDYTASERTFQLLHQVAGRVGRHTNTGRVFVQTYSPQHPAIELAANNDYHTFYKQELQQRQQALYPPFVHLMKITAEYASAEAARTSLEKLMQDIQSKHTGLKILGPAPAFHERFHAKFRWNIVVKAKRRQTLLDIDQDMPNRFITDIDPSTLL